MAVPYNTKWYDYGRIVAVNGRSLIFETQFSLKNHITIPVVGLRYSEVVCRLIFLSSYFPSDVVFVRKLIDSRGGCEGKLP